MQPCNLQTPRSILLRSLRLCPLNAILAQTQRRDLDEALGRRRVVVASNVHADQLRVVQRLVGPARNRRRRAAHELHLHDALHVLLAHRQAATHIRRLGAEPEALVDLVGECGAQQVAHLADLAVHGDGLDVEVGRAQHRAGRRLIHAAALQAHKAVLDNIDAADAVDAGNLVQIGENAKRRRLLMAVAEILDPDRHALLELNLDDGGRLWCSDRVRRHLVHVRGRARGWVLQHTRLVADVHQVGVHGPRVLLCDRHRDVVLARKLNQVRPAFEAVEEGGVAPGRLDLDAWAEGVVRQLKADLVVALARGAVRHPLSLALLGNLDLLASNARAGQRGSQEIAILVDGVGLDRREDKLGEKLLPQILHIDLLRTKGQGLGAGCIKVLLLADVGQVGNDVEALLDQPDEDARGVQAAAVGQDHRLPSGCGSRC
eukprot:m.211961 g.211961  ORF g.211961 m.211961 type:complete len:431 (-) comp19168_c0_seq1:25-1317(-)